MKAIILISSIFYLLGLKLSHTIDLVKSTTPAVSKVVIKNADESPNPGSINLKDAAALKPAKDSVQGGGTSAPVLQYK